MDYEIFKNNAEKRYAKQRLSELQESGGWQIILKALDVNIDYLQEELNSKRDHDNKEQIYLLLDRQNDLRKLKQLPKLLIEAAVEESEDLPDDSDPYESPTDDALNSTT